MQACIGGKPFKMRLYVVEGKTPLLISKPMLKELGAAIDLTQDKIELKTLGVSMPLRTTSSGNYQLNLCDKRPHAILTTEDANQSVIDDEGFP